MVNVMTLVAAIGRGELGGEALALELPRTRAAVKAGWLALANEDARVRDRHYAVRTGCELSGRPEPVALLEDLETQAGRLGAAYQLLLRIHRRAGG